MTDLLEALALLADSNIVHRDVKPENVMPPAAAPPPSLSFTVLFLLPHEPLTLCTI
jgi:serine/threonine protein kinase